LDNPRRDPNHSGPAQPLGAAGKGGGKGGGAAAIAAIADAIGAAVGDFVHAPAGQSAGGQVRVDGVQAERNHAMARAGAIASQSRAFESGDPPAQAGQGCLIDRHGISICSYFVLIE
jgi:hypothetical protein